MAFLRTISRIQIVWITNGVWCFWPRGCHRGMLHASLAVSKILVPGSWFSTLSLWCDRFFHWGSVLPTNRLLNFAPWSHSTCWPVLTVWWVFKTQRCQSWWFDPYSWLKWCLNGAIPWMNRFYAGCALKYAVLTSSKSKYDWKLKKHGSVRKNDSVSFVIVSTALLNCFTSHLLHWGFVVSANCLL